MRAQTTIDFVIGIVIFLAVLAFAFSFVPGILQPFELSDDEEPALSDRIANSLSQEKLGSAEQPHVLDRYCAVAFFNESRTDAPDDCNYDDVTLEDIFELKSFQSVNVSLEGNLSGGSERQQLCWADDAGNGNPGLVESDDCEPGEDEYHQLAKGDEVREGQGTAITARRVVSLDGESVTLEVILW